MLRNPFLALTERLQLANPTFRTCFASRHKIDFFEKLEILASKSLLELQKASIDARTLPKCCTREYYKFPELQRLMCTDRRPQDISSFGHHSDLFCVSIFMALAVEKSAIFFVKVH